MNPGWTTSRHRDATTRNRETPRSHHRRGNVSLSLAVLALVAASAGAVYSQAVAPTNSLPDPYHGMPFG